MFDPTVYDFLDPSALARLLTTLYIAIFATWGLSFNSKSRVNQSFFLMGVHALVWNLGYGFMFASGEAQQAEMWYRVSYMGVVFISPGVFLFTSAVTGRLRENRKWIAAGYLLASAWGIEGISGDFVIQGMWKTSWGFYPFYGRGGTLFLAFFLLFMAAALINLLHRFRTTVSRTRKRQLRLVISSFLIAYLGAWDFLPTAGLAVYPIGFVPIILFITILWWTNYRYQLLNPTPERLAKKVFQTIGEAIFVLDMDGFLRLMNPKSEELLGYRKEELLGRPISALLDPRDESALRRLLENPREKGDEPPAFYLNLRPKDGSLLPTSCTFSTIRRWRGKPLGAVLTCRDIRERLRKEAELRQSEERFRSLIENASDMIVVLHPSGKVLYKSPSNQRILGYGAELLPDSNPFALIHEEDAARVLEHFQRLLEKPGTSVVVEYRLRHQDGAWRYIESIAKNLFDDPVVGGIVINSRDITDRKIVEDELRNHRDRLQELVEERTSVLQGTMNQLRQEITEKERIEEERRQSEERFRAVVQHSSDIIVILEPDGTRRYVSPAAENALGFTIDELLSKNALENIHPDDTEHVMADFRQCLRNPSAPRHIEYRTRHKDGSWVYFETIANNLIENPAIRAILACSRDITKRKQDEAEIRKLNEELDLRVKQRTVDLEKAYEELRELDRLKDSFLSTVSHEFRTPLTAIRSFSEILLGYEGVEEKTRKEFLEIINTESERLTRLVNDVLDLSRIKAGRMVWQDEVLDMDVLIREVAKTHHQLLEGKRLRLTLVIQPGLLPAFADRDKIQQVLTNLLGNAIKFSSQQGEIRVRADGFEGKRFGETSQWIKLSVSDEGIGIEEKHFQLIFEHFRQITLDTLTDKPKGSGLGLPICKEIVAHYGGNIWVESKKGKGSVFSFTIPAASPTQISAENLEPAPVPDYLKCA